MPAMSRRQSRRPSTNAGSPVVTEFNPDYSHVKRDLSRIGVLAGSFFVLLIVLSFFLR
jgi:hypothetical protein